MALSLITTPAKIFKDFVLLNPLVTGPLLYVLIKGPDSVRDVLIQGIHKIEPVLNYSSSSDTSVTISIKALKWIVAIGVIANLNKFLSRLALNHWALRKRGEAWNFQSGKEIICITGGSSGFGAIMVKRFSEKSNATIVVIDVQDFPKDLAALPNVKFFKCDLTQPSQITEVTEAIKKQVGNPTVLINNAGIGKSATILEATPEWIEKIFRVNIMSHWQTVGAFLPAMLKSKKGHVVTMASMATFVSVANITDYCATKAGLLAFHEGLNQELKHRYENGKCIQTTIIHPTFAKTPLVTAGMQSSGSGKGQESKLLAPELISYRVVDQVLSGKSAQIFVPDNAARGAALRGWPIWLGEGIRDGVSRMTSK